MTRTGTEKGRSAPAASGWLAGTVTAYAAAIVAFAYALMSLYWALDGHALVSTTADTWSSSPAGAGHFPC
jgi:hypothetical protein